MRVCEEFVSVQGEGKYCGTPSFFIRTVGCNLRCSWNNPDGSITTCDTPYTSLDIKDTRVWNFEVAEFKESFLDRYPLVKHIVITGGEPTLQTDLAEVILQLEIAKPGMIYTIETNGTKAEPLEDLLGYIHAGMTTLRVEQLFLSISPKLDSSNVLGNKMHEDNNHWQFIPLLEKLPDYQIKFVMSESLDGSKVMGAMDVIGVGDHPERVYLMPQGIDPEVITKNAQYCVQMALHQGYTVTDRMHIRFFGNRREV